MAKPSAIIVRNRDTAEMMAALHQTRPSPAVPSEIVEREPSTLLGTWTVGQTVVVPVARVRESPLNARVYYSTQEVDDMAESLERHGQEVPAKGYVDSDCIVLIDGQKRLRGAKAKGIDTIRVEICAEPDDVKQVYLTSRRINRERSEQTFLDDAVRFGYLLEQNHFANQSDLAAAVELSQSTVSRILALRAIPERLHRRLKDTPITNSLDALYAVGQVFTQMGKNGSIDEAETLASDIIDEVVKRGLSGKQTIALVANRLAGPKRRDRNEVRHITFGNAKGVLKTNGDKGRLDFSVKDLEAHIVETLREKIEAWCHEVSQGAR